MKKITDAEELLLLRFIDQELSIEEQRLVEDRIQQSIEWKTRLQELEQVHTILKHSQTFDVPSKNFTQRVLHNLETYKPTHRASKNGLFLLIGIIVALGITSLFLSFGKYDLLNGDFPVHSVTIRKELVKIPTVSIHGKVIVDIILISTAFISLVLLDKIVLRPLFANRSRLAK